MKKKILAAVAAGLIAFAPFTAANAAPKHNKDTIYQVALLQSLTMGYFDGFVTVKELKMNGDTGIGTFEGLNGEMIVLDGVVYRANRDCKINIMNDKDKIPFSNVTFFENDFAIKLNNVSDKESLEKILNEHVKINGRNSFYMIKLNGRFKDILVRSESGSNEPYPTLVEALKKQNELTLKNVEGTIVGLYCPDYMSSLNALGWHFHFITSDKKLGGHVLGLNLDNGEAQFDKTDSFKMNIPKKNNFNDLNFNQDLKEDIRKAEQDSVNKN